MGYSLIKAYFPGSKYVALSVSGTRCELACPQCRGIYLRGMIDASNPSRLKVILESLYFKGARGFLISGGFNKEGYLMIKNEHLRVFREFIRNYNVVTSIHLGLAPRDLLESVWSAGIEVVDFEVPPSDDYLRVGKGLANHRVSDYVGYAELIADTYGRNFIAPHLVLNSRYASSEDELRVMAEISRIKPYIFVALIEVGNELDKLRVVKALSTARALFSNVSLGCMRPKNVKLIEESWIERGLIDRVAVPRRELVRRLNLRVINACCSLKEKYEFLFT